MVLISEVYVIIPTGMGLSLLIAVYFFLIFFFTFNVIDYRRPWPMYMVLNPQLRNTVIPLTFFLTQVETD